MMRLCSTIRSPFFERVEHTSSVSPGSISRSSVFPLLVLSAGTQRSE